MFCWHLAYRVRRSRGIYNFVILLPGTKHGGSSETDCSFGPTYETTPRNYVDAYRYYYANEKRHLFEWSKDRGEPPWIAEYTVDSDEDSAPDPPDGGTGDE